MEKNTVLAVVLSIVVLVGFYVVQGVFFPPIPVTPVQNAQSAPQAAPAVSEAPGQQSPPADNTAAQSAAQSAGAEQAALVDTGPQAEERVTVNTGLAEVTLTNAGGDMVSWKLKEHTEKEKEELVEMVLSGNSEAHAFSLAFGGLNARPVTSFFYVNRPSEYTVEFYREFVIPAANSMAANGAANGDSSVFRLTKRYDFKPNDYMFELTVTLDGGYSVPGFNFDGAAYTLAFGPQIGPKFEKLDNRYDYRQYFTYTNGKRKQEKANDALINSRPSWAAISGKYFTMIAIPYLAQFDLSFSEKPEAGLASTSRLNIIRPALNTPKASDTYRFYLGPKNQEALEIYNKGNNGFGLKDMQLIEVASSRGILSPLEKILKWLLMLFYKIIPNYGVAIILLTLLVKILFFPLTKKGSEATLRMQALSPRIKELQDKYKDNPQKLNAEMAAFYKTEGYNPLSGCLPMLLQIPIFFAMYNLFNNHFDLRGAEFIPRWIPDLSVPEAIWNFPDGARLPLLGWTALRLLPFIYVGSQLLYGKVTQTPDQQSNTQMKMMLYVMPVVFFFILYDVPSGLLIYWIFSNILTMVQQLAINKYLAPKRAAAAAAHAGAGAGTQSAVKDRTNSGPVIAPKKKKKK